MATLTKLSRGMLEDYIKRQKLKYTIDDDGDVKMIFSTEGKDYTVYLSLVGKTDAEFVKFLQIIVHHFPFSEEARLVIACNTWNRSKLFLRAYTVTTDEGVMLSFEQSLYCVNGVSKEQLDAQLDILFQATWVADVFCREQTLF